VGEEPECFDGRQAPSNEIRRGLYQIGKGEPFLIGLQKPLRQFWGGMGDSFRGNGNAGKGSKEGRKETRGTVLSSGDKRPNRCIFRGGRKPYTKRRVIGHA